jgi:hypothetical protein
MYDYRLAVAKDVREYINENIDLAEYKGRREELEEKLNEDLWIADSVTGTQVEVISLIHTRQRRRSCTIWIYYQRRAKSSVAVLISSKTVLRRAM